MEMIYVGKNGRENNEDCDDTNWGPIWEWNQCRLKIFWFVVLGGRNSIAVKNFFICDVDNS